MKTIACFIILFFSPLSMAESSYQLAFENQNTFILLNAKCSPCDLVCNNIGYQLLDKKNALYHDGSGKTFNIGVNKNFAGYTFTHNGKMYFLTESDDHNVWNLKIQNKPTNPDEKIHLLSEETIPVIFDNGSC